MERVNSIKSTTPYMLRNDGVLFSCGSVHPYIKMYYSSSFENNIDELFNVNPHFLDWFYEHTQYEDTKNLIENLRSNKDEETFNKLNNATNQEFCRVRTSNFKYKYGGDNGQMYFRISSRGFNWYDAIWKVVQENTAWIKYVTVMRDYQTFGKQFDYLKLKGQEVNEMPVDDFLTTSGNPILEKLDKDLDETQNLNEGDNDMNKIEKVDAFIDSLYELRQQSIAKDGEYGTGNLVFKEMRNKGYLDNLKELKVELENKELSLEGLNEQLNEAEDDEKEEMSLEDKLELCFTEKGCNYSYQNGKFIFADEDSFDKAYDSVNVLAQDSDIDVENMTIKIQGEQSIPNVASGSAQDADSYQLEDTAIMYEEPEEEFEESLELTEDIDSYSDFMNTVRTQCKETGENEFQNVYRRFETILKNGPEYIADNKILLKLLAWCCRYINGHDIKMESLDENASKDKLEPGSDKGKYEVWQDGEGNWYVGTYRIPFKIQSQEQAEYFARQLIDSDPLQEANQDPLKSEIYKKEANKQKKNPDDYMPRSGLGDPAVGIADFNHMMTGEVGTADGCVSCGLAEDANEKQKHIAEEARQIVIEYLKNHNIEGKHPEEILADIEEEIGGTDLEQLDYDEDDFDILGFISSQIPTINQPLDDLDRIIKNNKIGKWSSENGDFVIDATKLNKEDTITYWWQNSPDDIFSIKLHNYYGKTDVIAEFAKRLDEENLISSVKTHWDEIERDDYASFDIPTSNDSEDDLQVVISKEN